VQFHYRLEHPERFVDLVTLLAARVAQVLNMSALSNDLGISVPTVKSWLSILEASQVVYRLRPFHVNLGSRLVKAPKLYFTDVGLAAHLTGTLTRDAILRGPLSGALFENFIVQEALKAFCHAGRAAPLFCYRTHKGVEVDLVVESRPFELTPIEVKLAKTPHAGMAKGIESLRAAAGKGVRVEPGYVACMTERGFPLTRGVRAVPWKDLPAILRS
jgi:predicted AAA+ superfamily ATPase